MNSQIEPNYERICPICGCVITHRSYVAWCCSKKKNKQCGSCAQTERANRPEEKIARSIFSKTLVGDKNGFFGKKHSIKTIELLRKEGKKAQKLKTVHKSLKDYWFDKYGEEASLRLKEYNQKMSFSMSGEGNPMFGKPSPKGSGNGWSGWYKNWFFRSLKELSYVIKEIEAKGLSWRTAESSELKIEYIRWDGKIANYFADFIVNEEFLVECKPIKLHNSPSVCAKKTAAIEFCKNMGYTYILTDCETLKDEEIAQMRDQGELVFTDRYEQKFKERNRVKYP